LAKAMEVLILERLLLSTSLDFRIWRPPLFFIGIQISVARDVSKELVTAGLLRVCSVYV